MALVPFDALRQTVAPTAEPILLDEAKSHLRIRTSDTVQDSYIETLLIPRARKIAEDFQHRAYITQTWVLNLDCFPACGEILLPRPPLQSVSSIVYTLEDGTTGTVSSSDYVVDAFSEPGRILLKGGEAWPTDTLRVGPSVAVTFVAGYGAAGSSVPGEIRQAILLILSHLFENREAVVDQSRGSLSPLPMGVETLLMNDRFFA